MYTQKWLQGKVQEYSQQYWNMDCKIPVKINGRLTKTLGYYKYFRGFGSKLPSPVRFDFAARLLDGSYKQETIESVIKHEVCHYALSQLGKPFGDKDWNFLLELKRIGSHATYTIQRAGEIHKGNCSCCGKLVITKQKKSQLDKYFQFPRYWSKCCKAKIIYGGSYYREDNTQPVIASAPQPKPSIQIPNTKVATQSAPEKQSNPISNLIQSGPKGITNLQMIPAIKKAIDNNSKVNVQLLQAHYPQVYNNSLRYLGKSYSKKLEEMWKA